MEKIFFKQYNEEKGYPCAPNHEWTLYGSYEEKDITPEGEILCVVDDVDINIDTGRIMHTIYQEYLCPGELTLISEKEYRAVINKLREADGYNDKADEILKTLLLQDPTEQ